METALLKAAEMGRIESVKYLFVHGAGIEIKNEVRNIIFVNLLKCK